MSQNKLILVGAGPVGSLLSIFLAERGYDVEIYERRADMRVEQISAGRSINLALSTRGLHALSRVGVDQLALSQAVPMPGRLMHSVNEDLTFQPYGSKEQCIYSISRGGLNKILMTRAEETGRVKIHFNERVQKYDSKKAELELFNEKSGKMRKLSAPQVIGTDGSASAIREELTQVTQGKCTQSLLNYGYKELEIPAGSGGSYQMQKNALHIWPRGNFMLIALPNFDGSFTCTLFLPFEGEVSFAALSDPAQVREFFRKNFRAALELIPNVEKDFFGNPTGRMVTVKCEPWALQNPNGASVAGLVGDAAHAIVPFFGQGMNCGFEDCEVLDQFLGAPGSSLGQALLRFGESRKPDSDAIADMAVENFTEMRDKVADPQFLLQKQVEQILQKEFPSQYVSRYSMVSFSRAPYREALKAGVIQAEILKELCGGISSAQEINLIRARELIEKNLKI